MIGGRWKYFQLGFYVIFLLILIGVSLGSESTVGSYYKQWYGIPFLFLTLEIVMLFVTGGPGIGTSIFPMGSFDEDTYPLQKAFGYEGAFVIATVWGILLAAMFWNLVTSTGQSIIPVPHLLTEGFQVVGDFTVDFFSGRNAFGNAVVDSVVPTAVENSMLIMSFMLITWLPVRFGLRLLGVPDPIANIAGMISWIAVATLMFPFVYHAWSYQHVDVAYSKAAFFVVMTTIPTALTGFPIPLDLGHLGHNFPVSYYQLISIPRIVKPLFQVMV